VARLNRAGRGRLDPLNDNDDFPIASFQVLSDVCATRAILLCQRLYLLLRQLLVAGIFGLFIQLVTTSVVPTVQLQGSHGAEGRTARRARTALAVASLAINTTLQRSRPSSIAQQ